jgi:hypothetical protein
MLTTWFVRIFLVSIACATLAIKTPSSCIGRQNKSTAVPSGDPEGEGKKDFKIVTVGEVFVDNVHSQLYVYRAADDQSVSLVITHFKSDDEAKKASQERVQNAIKVINHDQVRDANGNITGERTLVKMAKGSDREKLLTVILLTKANIFTQITSYVPEDALAFEKQGYTEAEELPKP